MSSSEEVIDIQLDAQAKCRVWSRRITSMLPEFVVLLNDLERFALYLVDNRQ